MSERTRDRILMQLKMRGASTAMALGKRLELTFGGEFAVTGAANWKTYCDNTVEGYHLPSVHQRLARAVVGDAVEPHQSSWRVPMHDERKDAQWIL